MRESAVEMPVVRRAEMAGYYVRKVQWPGRRHAPDRLFARADRGTVFIEFKRPGESPRRGQTVEHERMRKAGIEVHVCDTATDALRILWLLPGHNGGPPLDDDWKDIV
jgi:hypothetical protein